MWEIALPLSKLENAGGSLPYVGPAAKQRYHLAGAAYGLATGPETARREPGAAQCSRSGAGPSADDAKGEQLVTEQR